VGREDGALNNALQSQDHSRQTGGKGRSKRGQVGKTQEYIGKRGVHQVEGEKDRIGQMNENHWEELGGEMWGEKDDKIPSTPEAGRNKNKKKKTRNGKLEINMCTEKDKEHGDQTRGIEKRRIRNLRHRHVRAND